MKMTLQPSNPPPEREERIIVNGKDIGRVYPSGLDNPDKDQTYGAQLTFRVGEYISTHGYGATKEDAIQAAINSAINSAYKLNEQAAALAAELSE